MQDDWLSKCVIDPSKRKVYLYSESGEKKTVDCDTVDEFMNVLSFVRSTTSEDMISYADPL
tara:strand:- start:47 stop:229 length:183 start_codon:yes stop_codon:yes gene_type:complete